MHANVFHFRVVDLSGDAGLSSEYEVLPAEGREGAGPCSKKIALQAWER